MPVEHKPRVAVVGAGVAGVSAAYHLREHAHITLYEREGHLGGHAHTVEVEDNGRTLGIDTAFVVFNEPAYPNLTAFFRELDVEAVEHPGGFNFFDLESGVEYGTRELVLEEDEVVGRYPEEFVGIWREARRFHTESRKDFLHQKTDVPLGAYLDRRGYSQEFRNSYVILLCAAVWSVPAELVWEMPASTVIAFYMGHDEGGLGGRRVDWRTVGGGSISYVRKAIAAIGAEVRTSEPVTGVHQDSEGVTVRTASGSERFDFVVVATHADQALALLENPTERQRTVLAPVRYNGSHVVLHTDASVMPADRSRWEAWNYGKVAVDGEQRTYVAYYMNKLQGFTAEKDYFVTLDYPGDVDPAKVIAEFPYSHPVIDVPVRELQKDIYDVNEGPRVKLCGSYFHSKRLGRDQIGSHEAAFSSGAEAAAQLLREIGGGRAGEPSLAGWDIAAADHGEWIPWGSCGKARARIVAQADGYHVALVEAEAGYRTDPHVHQHAEFLYLIEGRVSNQGRTITTGGAFAAAAGSVHDAFVSETPVRYVSIFKL
ncbi:FAD-dependent oxidoreductase [Streptomyces coffeae]|uniref:FAD-dependent oxidoreductase n=1 Tax=Streptomyces coffeae TaxID=621382 RepID=UPI001F1DD333|nr:FAD-dependent oxidoreductase [Streptomyces coffeae]